MQPSQSAPSHATRQRQPCSPACRYQTGRSFPASSPKSSAASLRTSSPPDSASSPLPRYALSKQSSARSEPSSSLARPDHLQLRPTHYRIAFSFHQILSQLLVTSNCQIQITLTRLLRLLLKTVQNPNGISKLGNVHHTINTMLVSD